jgi:ParB-like nuclease domain
VLQIEMLPVDRLVPYIRNARTHSEDQIAQIAALIAEFGFTNPILIAEDEVIIAGHGRLMAAKALGLTEVPVIVLDHLTEAQRRALVIADNRIAENAGWDDDPLRSELAALREVDFDLDLIGFDETELDEIMAGFEGFGMGGGDGDGDADGDGSQVGGNSPAPTPSANLAERFGIPPFSVFKARKGWWQDRKRAWLDLGTAPNSAAALPLVARPAPSIAAGRARNPSPPSPAWAPPTRRRSTRTSTTIGTRKASAPGRFPPMAKGPARTFGQDLMRGEHIVGAGPTSQQPAPQNGGVLMPSHTSGDPSFYAKKRAKEAELGRELTTEEFLADHYAASDAPTASGTSVFDPVLCEIAYRWFCPPGGTVLDPFAGGSVRGIVAARLGRPYVGIELRAEQVAANQAQASLAGDPAPRWIAGDSRDLARLAAGIEADLVFSCPPYWNLERYPDDPADLSTMPQSTS